MGAWIRHCPSRSAPLAQVRSCRESTATPLPPLCGLPMLVDEVNVNEWIERTGEWSQWSLWTLQLGDLSSMAGHDIEEGVDYGA